MRLEEAIKSTRFVDERNKLAINMLYTSYWLKNIQSSGLKEHGLTLEQHNVLRILKGSHPEAMCVKDIASRIVEKNSNVPRIVDRLVIKKLVTRKRSKEDKRETLISLTDEGIQLIDQARTFVDKTNQAVINLSEEEAAHMNELLEKLRSGSE